MVSLGLDDLYAYRSKILHIRCPKPYLIFVVIKSLCVWHTQYACMARLYIDTALHKIITGEFDKNKYQQRKSSMPALFNQYRKSLICFCSKTQCSIATKPSLWQQRHRIKCTTYPTIEEEVYYCMQNDHGYMRCQCQ